MLKGQIALTATRPDPAGRRRPTSPPPTTAFAFRSRANNRYVSAPNSGNSPLIATATTIGTAERFELVDLGGGNVALRARINSRIVCAENAGAAALIANRTATGPWETFKLVRNSNGAVSLLATVNNQYVCADNAGAAALIANRAAIGGWEQSPTRSRRRHQCGRGTGAPPARTVGPWCRRSHSCPARDRIAGMAVMAAGSAIRSRAASDRVPAAARCARRFVGFGWLSAKTG